MAMHDECRDECGWVDIVVMALCIVERRLMQWSVSCSVQRRSFLSDT